MQLNTTIAKRGIFILCMLAFTRCVTSPTGRSQLNLLSKDNMEDMGKSAFSEMKKKDPLSTDPKLFSYVSCVAMPLLEQVPNLSNVQTKYAKNEWEIQVFANETENAFALPGAKIGVHQGILKVAKTDAQLAAVLGHEIAHVLADHGNERFSHALAAQGGLELAGVLLEDNPNKKIILGALGVGAQFGVILPYSRTQESEADQIGQDLMAKAGFDPAQSIELWQNMMASAKNSPPEFLSTHPSNITRIERLKAHLEEANRSYALAKERGLKPLCSRP